MATILQRIKTHISKILTSKNAIKAALISKGAEVNDSTKFSEFSTQLGTMKTVNITYDATNKRLIFSKN